VSWIINGPLVLIKFLLKIALITPLFLLVFLLVIVYIRLTLLDYLICGFRIHRVWSLFMILGNILLLVVLGIFCNINWKGWKLSSEDGIKTLLVMFKMKSFLSRLPYLLSNKVWRLLVQQSWNTYLSRKTTKEEFDHALCCQYLFWKEKTMMLWFKDGEKNMVKKEIIIVGFID